MPTSRNAVNNVRLIASCGPALLLFAVAFAAPLAIVLMLSLGPGNGEPFTLSHFQEALTDPYFQEIFLRTFKLSAMVSVVAALVGTLEAFVLHNMQSKLRTVFLLAILGPLLIAVVVRTLGWSILLGSNGVIAKTLLALGIVETAPNILYTEIAIFIGLLHMLLPYMVLSVWTALQSYDARMERAAISLGATNWQVFQRVTLPQIIPGILSGAVLVFSLAMSAFATPALLGGRATKVVATAVYDEFLTTFNWPMGAALGISLLVINLISTVFINKMIERRFKGVFA